MKKRLMLLATLAVCSFTTLASNQLGLNIYLGGGLNFKDNDRDYRDILTNSSENKKIEKLKKIVRGYTFNVDITKNIGDYVELGVGTGYIKNNQYDYNYKIVGKENKASEHVKTFAFDNVPLYATAKVKFSKGKVKPYVKADLGYAFNVKYKPSDYTNKENLDPDVNDRANKKISWHHGVYLGGAIGVEAYNFFVEAKASHIFNDVLVGSLNETGYGQAAKPIEKIFKGNTLMGIRAGYKFEF